MLNKPSKSLSHKQLEFLKKRVALTFDQQKMYNRLTAGFQGETYFFNFLKNNLDREPIKLYDLRFKVDNSECQIDCLLIFQEECVLIEIKNYQGDFYFKNDGVYLLPSHEKIKSPFSQLERSELLLKTLLKQENIPLKIRSFIAFVHPEFHLYGAPMNNKVIFPTQMKRFVQSLNNIRCTLNKNHFKFEKLMHARHLEYSSYESQVEYDYDELQKGVMCEKCEGNLKLIKRQKMQCVSCEKIESTKSVVIRMTKEFHILFPNRKITVSAIYEWTEGKYSIYILRKILSESFVVKNKGKKTYYVVDEDIQ